MLNAYMNQVALATFSTFDTGRSPSSRAPERFYHGFVLRQIEEKKYAQGLMIEKLRKRGFGSMGLCLKGREC